jgi:MFS superfamily sulfate permease-like transporter
MLSNLGSDLPAGLVVFLVALPLCLGIALASDAPVISGVIAGIVGGIVVGIASGSQVSVSGPAAGLTAVVASAIATLGSFEAVLAAIVLSGAMQIVLAVLRAGILRSWIPASVIKGMLAGIGLVIIFKQIPHALGRDDEYVGHLAFMFTSESNTFTEIVASLEAPSPGAVVISLVAFAILHWWESVTSTLSGLRVLPAPLVAVATGVAINSLLGMYAPSWEMLRIDGHLVDLPVVQSMSDVQALIRTPAIEAFMDIRVWLVAATIAVVGSVESLLSLEAADGIDPQHRVSNPNRELFAQGLGNTISGLLGGLPITSVIVRTSANVYAGAQTRVSAIVHGMLLAVAVLTIAPYLNLIPYAALAAVLITIGYKLASVSLFRSVAAQGMRTFVPFLVTVLGVVFINLLWGVGLGIATHVAWAYRAHRSRRQSINRSGNRSTLS